ncbi:hypothetical protein OOZ15_10370 [Galbibacter sp. EGI 63066]|uniref:hypothetical protein n=1 Tax=Galbibacter sp. EGI 63066 TaxID=2993559 RepID=UPI0022490C6C|nr:hypothetical protein [Galbibacter sp. EGI 63066]MCX2680345.1 hypothetical protein [Galbibacter sp. EGI 63066]
MKNKLKTYFLLFVVLVIWGLIGYNIYASLYGNPTPKTAENDVLSMTYKPRTPEKQKSFSINRHERDPFLGTMSVKPKKNRVAKKQVKPKPETPAVNITYSGMVGNNDKKERIFFLSINGTQHLMKINDEMSGVKLISGDEVKIIVLENKKRRTIERS